MQHKAESETLTDIIDRMVEEEKRIVVTRGFGNNLFKEDKNCELIVFARFVNLLIREKKSCPQLENGLKSNCGNQSRRSSKHRTTWCLTMIYC